MLLLLFCLLYNILLREVKHLEEVKEMKQILEKTKKKQHTKEKARYIVPSVY